MPDILTVKKAVQEAARFYAKLYKMGFQIEFLDVGGGLGVDYDGSRSAFDSSTNYTLQEYTNDIVYYIADVCNAEKVPHPDIISESGRAIVAHHSVLIVEVFGAIEQDPTRRESSSTAKTNTPLVKELLDIRKNLAKLNKLEAYHDALERKEDAQHMFTLGMSWICRTRPRSKISIGKSARRSSTASTARPTCPRKSESSRTAWATNTSAISPCSSRCSITGRSASSSPSCRSAA